MLFFTAGAALGPLEAGLLVDAVGFRRATALNGLCLLAYAVIFVVVVAATRCSRRRARQRSRDTSTMAEALIGRGNVQEQPAGVD